MSDCTPPSPATTLTGREARRIREARGLSQAQLAAKLGVQKSYIAHLESGAHLMSLLIEAALRWIEATGGADLPAVCDGCAGEGVHRGGAPNGAGEPKFIRCDACGGTGIAGGDGRVIV